MENREKVSPRPAGSTRGWHREGCSGTGGDDFVSDAGGKKDSMGLGRPPKSQLQEGVPGRQGKQGRGDIQFINSAEGDRMAIRKAYQRYERAHSTHRGLWRAHNEEGKSGAGTQKGKQTKEKMANGGQWGGLRAEGIEERRSRTRKGDEQEKTSF